MIRPLEYRVRSVRLADEWSPATVARVTEEIGALVDRRDPTAVLEIRQRRNVERERRRRRAPRG